MNAERRQFQDDLRGVDLREPPAQRELLHRHPHRLEERPRLLQARHHRPEALGVPAQPRQELSFRAARPELVHEVEDAERLSHRNISQSSGPRPEA